MKKWFGQFPFPGWLILAFLFLIASIATYHFDKHQLTKENITQKIQRDFSKRQAVVYVDRLTGFFQRNNQDSFTSTNPQSYDWFILQNGKPINWNTNSISLTPEIKNDPDSFLSGKVLQLNYTTYYLQSWKIKDEDSIKSYALTFIPILYHYSFENNYFKSHFLADPEIPTSTIVDDQATGQGIPIFTNDKKPAFYLHFKEKTTTLYNAGIVQWVLSGTFLLCLFIFVHKCCSRVSNRKFPLLGWFILLGFFFFLIFLRFQIGLPSGFANATIFSPKLFSSNEMIPSLGDLIFFCLMDSWLILFFANHVSINPTRLRNRTISIALRLFLVVFLIFILFFLQADRIFKLVIDSKISFEASDFSQLSIFTFLGLFIITVITINFIFILSFINDLLHQVIRNQIFQYLFVFLIGMIFIYFLQNREVTGFYFIILFMCIAGLVLLNKLGLPLQFYFSKQEFSQNSNAYVWFLILCSWITIQIFYFNYSKEKEIRKLYAGKQEQRNDASVSYAFDNLSAEIQGDRMLEDFLKHPSISSKSDLDLQITYRYIPPLLKKFQISYSYYDKNRHPLLDADSFDIKILEKADRIAQKKAKSGIFYINEGSNRDLYFGLVPIFQNNNMDTLGLVGFHFTVNQHPINKTANTILHRNYNPSDQQYFDQYSYAIYKNKTLWTQGGDGIFPFQTDYQSEGKEYFFKETWFQSTLYYQSSDQTLIQVVYVRNLFVNFISLFSYVLAILFLIWASIFFTKIFGFYNLKGKVWRKRWLNFTIRTKVNLVILTTVLLSLVVAGVITISFMKRGYKDNQQKNLKNLIFYFSQNIVHFLEDNTLDLKNIQTDSLRASSELSYRLNVLAAEQGVNINLYNIEGVLIATSQSEKVQKAFISDYMNRSAFIDLRMRRYSDLFITEELGSLTYESLYLPLRNRKDEIIAYLNIPYYASQIDLDKEISNILATLINIYTLIFFISGIAAIFISNNLIKSFRLLIQQFRTIRLKHNVLINWPYRDELGLLVKEYNAMIMKVEDMATKLASREREDAWRELALQVAHEIKNPLTPMKLNIQYLQNAVEEGREDMPQLALSITKNLIKEIENLNLIATEFAHFAKMPEAKPELFNVSELLTSIVELFNLKEEAEIKLTIENDEVEIIMDKSYFRRIFTNLIKNAKQAIPENKEAQIEVDLKCFNKRVLIFVKDNGTGIDKEKQKRMFTPYFTTKSSGTGIGLSMSKKMVENSHGRIWFESRVGVGTIFYVQFPRA